LCYKHLLQCYKNLVTGVSSNGQGFRGTAGARSQQMTAEIQIPPIIKIGGGSLLEVPGILARLNSKRPLIVTDAFLTRQGLPGQLREHIVRSGISCGVFSETVPDPTT